MKRRTRAEWLAGLVLAVALAATCTARAQDAVLSQASKLLQTPAADGAVVASLAAQAPLSVLERKGGWYRVRGPGGEEGWVKLLAVRLTARSGAGAESNGESGGGAAGAALGAAGGGVGAAAAGGLGSMMTGSSADSTAVRGGASGKLSGHKMVDPAKAEQGAESSLQKIDSYEPSDEDMKAFEKEGFGDKAGATDPAQPK